MAQVTPSIVDLQAEIYLLKQKNASTEESLLVQSILLQNILEENTCLKKINSQARISPDPNTIKDIINRKKENEFFSYNYFDSSDIFIKSSLFLNHIMKNASDEIIIYIIDHLSNNEYVVPSPFHDAYWSVANFACYHSKLSILKYLIQNNIGTLNLDQHYIITASKFSNDETVAYLFDNIPKQISQWTFGPPSNIDFLSILSRTPAKKSFLCKNIDDNHNLDSINKIALKNKINN